MRTWVVNPQWGKGEREGRRGRKRRLQLPIAELWIPVRPSLHHAHEKIDCPIPLAPPSLCSTYLDLGRLPEWPPRLHLCSSAILSEDKPAHAMPVCPSLSHWFPVICRINSNFMLWLMKPSTRRPLPASLTSSITLRLQPLLVFFICLEKIKVFLPQCHGSDSTQVSSDLTLV